MLPIPDIQRLKPSLHGIVIFDQSDGLINAYSSIESHPAIRVTNQFPFHPCHELESNQHALFWCCQKSYRNGRTGSVVTTRTYEDGQGKHLLFRSRHGCLRRVSVGPELTFRGARNFTLSSSPSLTRFCYPRLSNRLAFVE